MTTTYEDEVREVERVAEEYLTVLEGLELLGRAADTFLDMAADCCDTMREGIDEAILIGDPRPSGPDGAVEYYASRGTIIALSVLADTAEDDLENPVQAWIRTCPKITALYRSDLGTGYWTDVISCGSEILLPSRLEGVSARLITGESDDYAQLIVSKGLTATIGLVHCPITIRQALNVAENC